MPRVITKYEVRMITGYLPLFDRAIPETMEAKEVPTENRSVLSINY
jgi:hypothetical protein